MLKMFKKIQKKRTFDKTYENMQKMKINIL